MTRNWDDNFYSEEESPRITISGMCSKCKVETKATHKYNQLKPMCHKHYLETLAMVNTICK